MFDGVGLLECLSFWSPVSLLLMLFLSLLGGESSVLGTGDRDLFRPEEVTKGETCSFEVCVALLDVSTV